MVHLSGWMEALSFVDGGFLFGCKFRGKGQEGMIISHLLFVDGTILF